MLMKELMEKFGTERIVSLTSEEVEKRLQAFIDLVQFDIAAVNS